MVIQWLRTPIFGRCSTSYGGFIEKLISVIVAENGVVTLPKSPMKINGPALREFLSSRATKITRSISTSCAKKKGSQQRLS